MKNLFLIPVVFLIGFSINAQNLIYRGDAQIEVGSFYAGLEFHHSSPMLQRVSFYFPSANSLDQSTDYWKRDSSFVMAAAIKSGNKLLWLNHEKFDVQYLPYKAVFLKSYKNIDITVTYQFLKNEPAFAVIYEIISKSSKEKFQFYTDLEAAIKTSHTYKLITGAQVDDSNSIQYIDYKNNETRNASLFCINKGDKPKDFSLTSGMNKNPAGNEQWWLNYNFTFNELVKRDAGKSFRYLYEKELSKGDTLKIVQLFGSAPVEQKKYFAENISRNYLKEIKEFEEYAVKKNVDFITGDKWIDNTIRRSEQILSINMHYIDNNIVPMPCPAEYNFYFTHDVLLTDLAVVNFDIARVKRDLSFIALHSREDSIIPHAYYWKDSAYVTEYCDPDNWNHFWFIIASAKYLLYSGDSELLNKLYPLIYKSMNLALTSKRGDLMNAKRPDWWDIGNNYGPRSYTTSLAIKSLREFIYISSLLEKSADEINYYYETAASLQKLLNELLWDKDKKYLFNIMNDSTTDYHYYTGSLIANHFNTVDNKRKEELVNTATAILLDVNLGIYNAYPMDFHNLTDYYRFVEGEAGARYYYMNGGIWPHGNAWYALALKSGGQRNEAFNFVKKVMTVDGILQSSNGQPAMYEVRIPDKNNLANYGKVDKPQFMWSAGWYLYTLYNLFGIKEEEWNLTLDPWKPAEIPVVNFSLSHKNTKVQVSGNGNSVSSIMFNNSEAYSLVLPADMKDSGNYKIQLGKPRYPYIKSADCIINDVFYDSYTKVMEFTCSSFQNKIVTITIISPEIPSKIFINGNETIPGSETPTEYTVTSITFPQGKTDRIRINF